MSASPGEPNAAKPSRRDKAARHRCRSLISGAAIAVLGLNACHGRGRAERLESEQTGRAGHPASASFEPPNSATERAVATSAEGRGTREEVLFDMVHSVERCVIDHGGPVFDFGSTFVDGMLGSFALAPAAGISRVERDGASWASIESRELLLRFVLDERAPLAIAARARAGAGRSVSVWLDGRPLGVLVLPRGAARTVATRSTAGPIAPGAHALRLRFNGGPRAASEPLAEVDWIRAAVSDEEGATYAAPTEHELVADVKLGSEPHRALGLRAPGTIRCPVRLAPHAHLHMAIGLSGAGEASAELRVVHEGREGPVISAVRAVHVMGGDNRGWTPIDWDLGASEPGADPSKIAQDAAPTSIELAAVSAPTGSRILFGDPVIAAPVSPPHPSPAARVVALLVLSGIEPSRFPPRVEEGVAPNLTELLRASVAFDRHRAPTTISAGVVASLLTGMPPRKHLVEDGAARLADDMTTVGSAARDGSVQTAMFTGCPPTFAAFGFARGWDKFRAYSPVSGEPAVAPIADAAHWIVDHVKTASDRALVVVHARGGHPPWDVTPSEAAKLPPSDYAGPMEPRRSAELLARARAPSSRFHLSEADRARMWAIYEAALLENDHAIGQFIDILRKHDLWNDTMLVLTGDVGVDPTSRTPFGDGEDLGERVLSTPLWVKFPGGDLAGTTVSSATDAIDVTRTIFAALRLDPPHELGGNDLHDVAAGGVLTEVVPAVATLGARYATRWGDFVLSGAAGRAPILCALDTDPGCEHDASEEHPFLAQALFRFTYRALTLGSKGGAAKTARGREPATLDPDTSASLMVWGQREARSSE